MQKEKVHTKTEQVRVLDKEWLAEGLFILRLERKNLSFRPGQYIVLHLNGESREYSLCSGVDDAHLEILIRLVKNGIFTPCLNDLSPGDVVEVEGPYGFFLLRPEEIHAERYFFIATGTGISPFLSFIRSSPGLDYILLHGVRNGAEAMLYKQIPDERRVICSSRDEKGDFNGRVTGYLHEMTMLDDGTVYYLCGNAAMIDEVTGYLEDRGVDPFDIRQEVFF